MGLDVADAAGSRGRPASRAGTPGRNREEGAVYFCFCFFWKVVPPTGPLCAWLDRAKWGGQDRVFMGVSSFLKGDLMIEFHHYSKPV